MQYKISNMSIQVKNLHEKLTQSIQTMLIDVTVNLPYYGNFNLFLNFHENNNMPTCGVNVTGKGMNFYYNSEFLNKMSQKEVNFITLHEDFHLLFNHPKRTISGQFNHKLSNIAQDMIINHIICEDIPDKYIEIPKDDDGRNMALFVPKEYTGSLIFEELYQWLRDKKEEHDKKKECKNECQSCGGSGKKQDQGQTGKGDQESQDKNNGDNGNQSQQNGDGEKDDQNQDGNGQGEGQQDCDDCNGTGKDQKNDSSGKPSYGPYGKDPKSDGGTIDTYSLDQMFDDLDNNEGQYLDSHMTDEVPEELRESMVKDAVERLKMRGLSSANIENTLNKLQKKRKDHLRYIKRCISNQMFGTKKTKTIQRPNRRQIFGVKGTRKIKSKVNVILDVSGSMHGLIEKVLNYIYKNEVEINLIQADTQVNAIENFKNTRKIESMKIIGYGGTVLQPSIEYTKQHFNQYPTLLLTDGYCDTLDLSGLKQPVLIITAGDKVPISKTNGKVKEIVVTDE